MTFLPFVITCNGRDGSTFTGTSLNKHPRIAMQEELLISVRKDEHEQAGSAQKFLTDQLYGRSYPEAIQAVGFRIKWFHAQSSPIDDARDYLHGLNVKVIHLERRNYLKNYISGEVAEKTNLWADYSGKQASQATVRIDPSKVLKYFEEQAVRYTQNRNDFKDHESMSVVYEEIVTDYDKQMSRMFQFLGVPDHEVEPRTFQQEHRPIRQIVTNYQELFNALQGTAWESFLSDEL